MTLIEFYETHWKVQKLDGTWVTPKLRDEERAVYAKADELGCKPYLLVKGRKQQVIIVNPLVEAELIKESDQ